jgi:hypothetical protein
VTNKPLLFTPIAIQDATLKLRERSIAQIRPDEAGGGKSDATVMPAEREAREPVPRATGRAQSSWPWVPDISLAAKFRDDNSRVAFLATVPRKETHS